MGLRSKAKLIARRAKRAARGGHLSLEPLQGIKPLEQKPLAGESSLALTRAGKKTHARHPPAIVRRCLPSPSPRQPGARVWNVTTKVVGPQAMIDARNEQEALRLAKWRERSWAPKMSGTYGSIGDLRSLLGLPPPYTSHCVSTTCALPENALIVSLDTESEYLGDPGDRSHVVEIGITVLDTRDIIGTAPGLLARNWIPKAKTYHYVLDSTVCPTRRMRACYFSDDRFGDVSSIRKHLLRVLREHADPSPAPKQRAVTGPRKVVLVGHSVMGDISLMRCLPLGLDFWGEEPFHIKPTVAFDTFSLTDAAIRKGAAITSSALGKLVCWLGIPAEYQQDGRCIGWHNAGNDAAYTMMALLIYAVRWENVILGNTGSLSRKDLDRAREQRSAPVWRLPRENATPICDGVIAEHPHF